MFISKKKALESIRTVEKVQNGVPRTYYEAYLGINPLTRAKVRFMMADRFELVHRIDEFYLKNKRFGDSIVVLRPDEAYDARAALEVLRAAGYVATLRSLAEEYVARRKAKKEAPNVPLETAFNEYLASFPEVQKKHRESIVRRVGAFVGRIGANRSCASITAKEVAEFLERFDAPKTYNNNLGYIKSFFNWCASPERQYVLENPIARMKQKQIAHVDPQFLAPEDVEKLLRHFEEARDYATLAYLVLSYFCGIRAEEIIRLSMQDGDILSPDAGSIRIGLPKGWTRGVRPRTVPLARNAAEWIRQYGLGKALVGSSPNWSRRLVYMAAEKMGMRIPHNAGRHTFITMHVAAFHNEQVTQTICGTSKDMLVRNYMGLATDAQGKAYFAIMPKTVDTANGNMA